MWSKFGVPRTHLEEDSPPLGVLLALPASFCPSLEDVRWDGQGVVAHRCHLWSRHASSRRIRSSRFSTVSVSFPTLEPRRNSVVAIAPAPPPMTQFVVAFVVTPASWERTLSPA